MKNKILVVALTLLLCSCSREVEVARKYGNTTTEVRNVGCSYTKPDYCMDCGLSFNGEFDCSPRFKFSCSHLGHQQIKVEAIPLTIVYQSGMSKTTEIIKKTEYLSECK